jgi:hypothetical protein
MFLVTAIAINNNGLMYGIDEMNDNLVRINKLTGTVTTIGPLGFNANGISGCDFDPVSGRLYFITPGAINPELRWIDTTGTLGSAGSLMGNVKNLAIAGNNFQTPPLPSTPTLIYPVGTIYTTIPLMDWSDAPGATTYHIQVSSGAGNVIDLNTAQSQYQVPPGVLNINTPYYWRVYGRNGAGIGEWSVISSFTCMITGINKLSSEIPKEFSLSQNYPNPFNPVTKIRFDIKKSESRSQNSEVTLKIFDITGKEVATLVNERLQPGTYEVKFDIESATEHRRTFGSGVYFYTLITDTYKKTRRLLLIK